MPPSILYVNDVDMSEYGLWVNTPDGWFDAPRMQDTVQAVSGLAGGVLSPSDVQVSPRELTFEAMLIADSHTEAHALWDQVKQRLAVGELEIRFEKQPDRVAKARYQAMSWIRLPGMDMGASLRLSFLMPNPYFHARAPDIYTLTSGQTTSLSLGTAPSFVDLYLSGTGQSEPTASYYDAQGNLRGLLTFDLGVALTIGQWIYVDGQTRIMLQHTDNYTVHTNVATFLKEPYNFFVADPNDGDDAVGPYIGALNCNLVAHVWKAYR
jgi:phage-related protein